MTEDIAKREITLPLYPAMNNDDGFVVVSAVQASLNLNWATETHEEFVLFLRARKLVLNE